MANRCYVLNLEGTLGASYRLTTLHFQSGNTADGDTVAAGESLLAAFNASLKASFLATLPPSYNLIRMTCRRVDLKPSATTCMYFGFGPDPGTRGTDATAQQTCPSVFLVPTMGVKSGGKIFWPAIPQADITDNSLTTAWQTALGTFLTAAIAGITNAGMTWTLCIFSRKSKTFSTITSHSMSPVIGFQSKRRKPVGSV